MSNGPCTEAAYPTNQYAECEQAKQCIAREQTAQETLSDLIGALEHKLRMLKDLQKALPVEMPFSADQMLRELINQLRANRPDKY